jgi:hypothetical protein
MVALTAYGCICHNLLIRWVVVRTYTFVRGVRENIYSTIHIAVVAVSHFVPTVAHGGMMIADRNILTHAGRKRRITARKKKTMNNIPVMLVMIFLLEGGETRTAGLLVTHDKFKL